MSTWRFPTKEGPRFTKTAIMNVTLCVVYFLDNPPHTNMIYLCSSIVMVVGSLINMVYLRRKNQAKEGRRAEILAPYVTAEHPDGGAHAWAELGDKHPDFKYQL